MGHITEYAMKQISEAFGRRLKETGVTRIQWIALYFIAKDQPITQGNLSRLMDVKDSSGGRLLDRMERDGLILRNRSQKDKRVIYVSLTDKGNSLFQELLPYGDHFNNDLIEGIEEEELKIFEKVLAKMVDNISKEKNNTIDLPEDAVDK